MKWIYHIPTEQYGFVEVEADGEYEAGYNTLAKKVRGEGGTGIPELDFTRLIDRYCETGSMLSEEYEALNDKQQYTIQTYKKQFKRNGKN